MTELLTIKEASEWEYTPDKENEFSKVFERLREKYNLVLKQNNSSNFLDKYYLKPVKSEIDFVFEQTIKVKNVA